MSSLVQSLSCCTVILRAQQQLMQLRCLVQVAQLDAAVPQAATPGHAEPRMVDVIELMAAVLEDSPSNRLTMLHTSGVLVALCLPLTVC